MARKPPTPWRWQQLTVSITVIVIGFTVVWMAVAWSSVWTLTAIFAKRPHAAAAEFRNVWLPVSAAMLQGGLSGPLAASVIGRDMRRARWLCNAYGIVMASYLAWLFVPDRTPLSIVAVAVVAATAFVVARRRSSWISWLTGVWAAAAILGMTFGVSKDEPVMLFFHLALQGPWSTEHCGHIHRAWFVPSKSARRD